MNLTPELVADILVRQGRIAEEHAEAIRKEARQVPSRLRSHSSYEQKALAYDMVTRLRLPDLQNGGGPIGELEIAQTIAKDAGLPHVRIDTLNLNADLIES